jgi:hypothetical protein
MLALMLPVAHAIGQEASEAPPFLSDRGAVTIAAAGEDYLLTLSNGRVERWTRVGTSYYGPNGLRFDRFGSEYIGSNGDRYSRVGNDWYVQRGGKTTRFVPADKAFGEPLFGASATNLTQSVDTNAAARRARAAQLREEERVRHHFFRPGK